VRPSRSRFFIEIAVGLGVLTAAASGVRAQRPTVQCEPIGPILRGHGLGAALAPGRGLFIWGGEWPGDTTPVQLLVFHPANAQLDTAEILGSAPASAFIPAMAADERRSIVYVFGGWARRATHPTDEFHRIDLTQGPYRWQEVARTDPWPSARNGAALVYDPAGDALLMFAGDSGPGPGADRSGFKPLRDLWRFDLRARRWERIPDRGEVPSPRWQHMMAVDPSNGRAYLIGGDGFGAAHFDSSLYELDLRSLAWRIVTTRGDVPPSFQGGTLTFDREHGMLVLAGGLRHRSPGDATISEVWVFDLGSGTWFRTDCGDVLRRRDDVGAYDPQTRAHYLVGGVVSPAVARWGQFGSLVSTIVRLKVTTVERGAAK